MSGSSVGAGGVPAREEGEEVSTLGQALAAPPTSDHAHPSPTPSAATWTGGGPMCLEGRVWAR